MFSYTNAEHTKHMPWNALLRTFLVLPLLMACMMDFFEHSRQIAEFSAFLFFALRLFDRKPVPDSSQPSAAPDSTPTPLPNAPALPLSWKIFAPIAALCSWSLLIWPLWPVAGSAVLVWLLSYFAWDYYESSRFGRSPFTILSLR
ncbi:MAG TPA: hypothetical protein VOA78_12750 [Candidatus Dormibacteraeota bacterium]|nr:hypothetical protein [Candidatus Dormibacteraeota bacterium]